MAASSLPPRGVFVPTQLIFHPELPATVLVTWIRLRGLAWKGWATPPFSLAEFAAQLGIHPARLQKHLAHLQALSALSLEKAGQDKVIISFPEGTTVMPNKSSINQQDHSALIPGDREMQPVSSYFPKKILGYLSFEDEEEEPLPVSEPEIASEIDKPGRVQPVSPVKACRNQSPAYLPR